MLDVIDKIVSDDISEADYNQDYIMKLNNINYQKYLSKEQLSLKEFKTFLINNHDDVYKEINDIKSEFLYHSITHGINHNIRVLLFAFYLGKQLKLSDIDMRIILDACKYHDVGRTNDLYDESHGLRSAQKVDKIVDSDIYKDLENLNTLKAMIEYHSIPDSKIDKIINKYKISNTSRFKILASILKDADGLDRVRLSMNNRTFSDLNPKYLRIPYSLSLIKCSHLLNSMFINLDKKKLR